ncbi:MAG: hypothetical protein JXB14_05010 [Candidatus Altiarchaeota archaeon]|nr:hypothetical protein [Candidatus Altiarchaeota archaeon]
MNPIGVEIKTDKTKYKLGEPIEITYVVRNNGKKPVVFFDRPFLTTKSEDGQDLTLLTPAMTPRSMNLCFRADWRESKNEYVRIGPGERIEHSYDYTFYPNKIPPKIIYVQYDVTRKDSDNFYYDFQKEGIAAITTPKIKAWTGTVTSNSVKVEIIK